MPRNRNDTSGDVPPPPYSETDIYSNSGHSPALGQSQTLPIRERTASQSSATNAGLAGDDASSISNGEVIYTPPLTPRSPHSQSQLSPRPDSDGPRGSNVLLSPSHPPDGRSSVSVVSDGHLSSASAEAYFESRPAPARLQAAAEVRHNITIRDGSSPNDFPFRSEWTSRDVRPEDWQTFLNHLLPNHAAEQNDVVADRKLRAEGLESSVRDEGGRDDHATRTSVEAQLDQMRWPRGRTSREDVDEMVREWNDGFFEPRGLVVAVEHDTALPDGGPPRMPGSWENSFDDNDAAGRDGGNVGSGRWWKKKSVTTQGTSGSSGRGVHFGGLHIDDDRVSIGNSFVVDSNGVRIGSFGADSNGVRMGSFRQDSSGLKIGNLEVDSKGLRVRGRDFDGVQASSSQGARGQTSTPDIPQTTSTSADMPPPAPPAYQSLDEASSQDRPDEKRGAHTPSHRHHHHAETHGERGGRGHYRMSASHQRHRSASASSSSSSISSSSSSSSSSTSDADTQSDVGSLPDYEDLRPSQISVAQSYLQDWLAHPDEPLTRERVRQARDAIKSARKDARDASSSEKASGLAGADRKNDAADPREREAARRQVRDMLMQFSQLKRQQKQARRQQRREQKAKRRAEKRERRQARRDMRRAKKQARKEARAARRESKREGRRCGCKGERREQEAREQRQREQQQRDERNEKQERGPGSSTGPAWGHAAFGGGPAGRGGRHGPFPGAAFGPGARGRHGPSPHHNNPHHPFQTPPPPPQPPQPWCGRGAGRGGAFAMSGQAYQRSMEDWSRRMSEWGQRVGAEQAAAAQQEQRRLFPGAWPSDDAVHAQGVSPGPTKGEKGSSAVDDPHAVSTAMFRELETKRAQLQKKRDALAEYDGQGDGSGSGDKAGASTLAGMLAEIEELHRSVEHLSVEADEQFAKELAGLE